jgi:hypothetical protein
MAGLAQVKESHLGKSLVANFGKPVCPPEFTKEQLSQKHEFES